MTPRKMQVFVSSTYTDLREERQAAVEAILTAGHIPAGMELFAAGDESQWEAIKRWIDDCDIYMLILGARYGSIEPTSKKSYIQLEYEYAVEKKKPFFAAVMHDSYRNEKVKAHGVTVLEQDHPDQYKAFRETVLTKMSRFFDRADAVKLIVHESLPQLIRDRDLVGWIRGADAKTIEDVEARADLEKQVRSLQDRIKLYEDSDGALIEELASGSEPFEVRLETSKGNDSESATWDDLFRVAGKACLTNPGRDYIADELADFLISRCYAGVPERVASRIVSDDFATIQNQFVALKYITIESAYRQAAQHTTHFGSGNISTKKFSPGWVSGWRLTDRGQRKLAELTAIRRTAGTLNAS